MTCDEIAHTRPSLTLTITGLILLAIAASANFLKESTGSVALFLFGGICVLLMAYFHAKLQKIKLGLGGVEMETHRSELPTRDVATGIANAEHDAATGDVVSDEELMS
ncbi:hypothetical protein ACF07B_20010 [Streptomyces sp. NPDC015532]|uniref:hypothetical protein n=1 Tax=Streptomyces sp. NPDC015532 TaxID=3364960 RepID=UPI0036FF796B